MSKSIIQNSNPALYLIEPVLDADEGSKVENVTLHPIIGWFVLPMKTDKIVDDQKSPCTCLDMVPVTPFTTVIEAEADPIIYDRARDTWQCFNAGGIGIDGALRYLQDMAPAVSSVAVPTHCRWDGTDRPPLTDNRLGCLRLYFPASALPWLDGCHADVQGNRFQDRPPQQLVPPGPPKKK